MSEPGVSYGRIPIEEVTVGERLRRTDPAWVEALSKSMKARGLLQPIRVTLEEEGTFSLSSGGHRLEAARELGWTDIPAVVVEAAWINAQERLLDEILENLVRHELTKLDRARALYELKRVYSDLYPETRRGGDRKSRAAKEAREDQTAVFAIRSEIAEEIGLSQRSIRLAVSIWEGLSEKSRERLPLTAFANHQQSLQLLSQQPHDVQDKALGMLMADHPRATTVADAIARIEKRRQPTEAERRWTRALASIERLKPGERRRLFTQYEDEVRAFAKLQGWLN